MADFRRFLGNNPFVRELELSNYGEALLNPEFIDILRHARERGVRIHLGNGLNLNHAGDEALEALVKYRVRLATISIDGASQATYVQYRVGGSFEAVIANVEKINVYKIKYRTPLPILVWQFVVFEHNSHEIETAKALAQSLKMLFRTKRNWDAPSSRATAPSAAPGAQVQAGVDAAPDCLQLWNNPQVNWNGKVLGCCVNYWGEFGGNAFTDPPDDWLNSEKMVYARQMLTGNIAARANIPCTTCHIYKDMVDRGDFIRRKRPGPAA